MSSNNDNESQTISQIKKNKSKTSITKSLSNILYGAPRRQEIENRTMINLADQKINSRTSDHALPLQCPNEVLVNPLEQSNSTKLDSNTYRKNSLDQEFEANVLNIIASAKSDKKNLPILIEGDSFEYNIEGYVQLDSVNLLYSNQGQNQMDNIENEEILETNKEFNFYSKHFLDKEHFNFVGKYDNQSSFLLSVKYQQSKIRCILRTKEGNNYEEIDLKDISSSSSNPENDYSIFQMNKVIQKLFYKNQMIQNIKPVLHPMASEKIAAYDKKLAKTTFTFGIIYQKVEQISEKEIFNNKAHSKDFDEFLDFIGERIELKNFQKFRGGLDIVSNDTGTESVYTLYDNLEIMFHVSTLLPHSNINEQQLERKRHIGNDRVTIIFQDECTPFSPKMIKSRLLHVFIIVQPHKINDVTKSYKISVISKKDVPYFEPIIRRPYLFKNDLNFKHFLLTKLINAEYASLKAPAFSIYSEKSIEHSLKDLNENLENLTSVFTTVEFHQVSSNMSPNNEMVSLQNSLYGNSQLTSSMTYSSVSNINIKHQVGSFSNNSFSTMKNALRRFSLLQVLTNTLSTKSNPNLKIQNENIVEDKPVNVNDNELEDELKKFSKQLVYSIIHDSINNIVNDQLSNFSASNESENGIDIQKTKCGFSIAKRDGS